MTVWVRPRPSSQYRQTGLSQSYSRWVSQFATLTSGGPLPWRAHASLSPSVAVQKRICWCAGATRAIMANYAAAGLGDAPPREPAVPAVLAARGAARDAVQQHGALASVLREREGALELGARVGEPAQLLQQVAAHGREEVIAVQGRLLGEVVDEPQCLSGPERHADRDRAVEVHDRRRRDLGEAVVDGDDAHPVGVLRRPGARVAGGDRGLQRVRADGAARRVRALQGGEPAANEHPVPARAVLVEQEDRLAVRPDPRAAARRL